jgi:hypothetical protein
MEASCEESQNAASTGRGRWVRFGLLAAVAAVVAGAIAVFAGGEGEFEMWGAVRLDSSAAHTTDDYCVGGSYFLDIREGAPVRVYGDNGKLLATGALQKGRVIGGGLSGDCGFDFSVSGIPDGHDRYEVRVDDEKPLALTPEAAKGIVLVELR